MQKIQNDLDDSKEQFIHQILNKIEDKIESAVESKTSKFLEEIDLLKRKQVAGMIDVDNAPNTPVRAPAPQPKKEEKIDKNAPGPKLDLLDPEGNEHSQYEEIIKRYAKNNTIILTVRSTTRASIYSFRSATLHG
jgi:hypothetical protein